MSVPQAGVGGVWPLLRGLLLVVSLDVHSFCSGPGGNMIDKKEWPIDLVSFNTALASASKHGNHGCL